ncbi:MAG: isochorismatase family protein [Proteobacteria bacterium]|nr:isochorismatase family protein [Pseudomonadota bacterium]MBU1582136.1 isochorismatase family protein [Pseudomonadota bacterium]MBU2454383.1 isochorismatase family protein [Pseudomonadota bacterium]MBU2631762.1 isochorismatase family protein [Pseudomonadota bacterium]
MPELKQEADDLYVEKEANDSFYKTNMSTLLKKFKIDHLYITGYSTDFCVNATECEANCCPKFRQPYERLVVEPNPDT